MRALSRVLGSRFAGHLFALCAARTLALTTSLKPGPRVALERHDDEEKIFRELLLTVCVCV